MLVKLLQTTKNPVMILPTDYCTTTEADICYGVGVGIIDVKVIKGDLYIQLPKKDASYTYKMLRQQHACKIHHKKETSKRQRKQSHTP